MKLIITDLKRCVGCHSCELACAISRSRAQTLLEAISEEPRPRSRVKVIAVDTHPIPMQCHQCEDAPCASVCPTKALSRQSEDQPVLFSQELCIGCSSCVLVCPFGAVKKAPGGIMAKCNLCWERLKQGLEPACIKACPNKARSLGNAELVAEQKLRKMAGAMVKQELEE